ncbi:prepilin-type N-terminal cleavage/methylation domain-containing protein [Fibrobacter sp.]
MPSGLDRVVQGIYKDGAMQDAKRKLLDCTLAADRTVRGCRGFTLMELMVYIAIVGIVVIVAGQAFSNSTKMRVRTQSMLKASEVAENVAALMKDDIAQTGAKSAIDASASDPTADVFALKDSTYMDPKNATVTSRDSSSYDLTKNKYGTGFDQLTVRRINHNALGEYVRLEEVSWYAKANGKLYRKCVAVRGTQDAENCTTAGIETEIAEGVTKFSVLPSKPLVLDESDKLFPNYSDATKKSFRLIAYENSSEMFVRADPVPLKGDNTVSMTNLITNFRSDGDIVSDPIKHMFFLAESVASDDDATTAWKNCKNMVFKMDSTYEISFEMTDMGEQLRMFRPGVDHFAVGIRDVSGDAPRDVPDVPDFLIYPPAYTTDPGKRSVSFTTHGMVADDGTKTDVTGCLTFTISLFSPTVSLLPFSLTNIVIRRINDGNYAFDEAYTPAIADKKNVKAFRIDLTIKKNGEGGTANLVIPIPSNGG